MKLAADEERMLAGEFGPGVQMALGLLIAVGEAYEAERLIDISSSHILSPEMQFWNTGQLSQVVQAALKISAPEGLGNTIHTFGAD